MRNATDVAFCIQDVGSPFPVYVPGGAIAFPASTTAQGLFKVGNIDIDAQDAVASSVDMGNTANSGFTLNVHGSEVIDNNLTVTVDASIKGYAYCNSLVAKYNAVTHFGFLFDGAPTALRTVTLPDKSGTMAVGTTAAAIADLVVGVATVDDCAAAINSILAVLRGFEQVAP